MPLILFSLMTKAPQGSTFGNDALELGSGQLELPDLLSVRQAAEILHVKPCTVRNERLRGKLGFVKIGMRIFYTRRNIVDYLERQQVTPCAENQTEPDSVSSGTIGSARIQPAPRRPTHGAEHGTIPEASKRAARALVQQIFSKPPPSSRNGSSNTSSPTRTRGRTKS